MVKEHLVEMEVVVESQMMLKRMVGQVYTHKKMKEKTTTYVYTICTIYVHSVCVCVYNVHDEFKIMSLPFHSSISVVCCRRIIKRQIKAKWKKREKEKRRERERERERERKGEREMVNLSKANQLLVQ